MSKETKNGTPQAAMETHHSASVSHGAAQQDFTDFTLARLQQVASEREALKRALAKSRQDAKVAKQQVEALKGANGRLSEQLVRLEEKVSRHATLRITTSLRGCPIGGCCSIGLLRRRFRQLGNTRRCIATARPRRL
jgi:hypothetical protein